MRGDRADRTSPGGGGRTRSKDVVEHAAVEHRIGELAAGQHGLITRAQLLGAGLGRDAVKYRVRAGRLRVVQGGVYRVGPVVSPKEREMAAALACGPGAVISHRSVAWLWHLVVGREDGAPVHVTVRSTNRRRRPGVQLHRTGSLEPAEVTLITGIPATSAARTLLDFAAGAGSRELEQALARAERHDLTSAEEILRLLAGHPRHRGAPALRVLVGPSNGPSLTRSEAEERLLALVRKAQLPAPETNVRIGGMEVDLLWRAERLVVEVDGFAFHSSARRFEQDRSRDGRLAARGLQVIRVTWRQLVNEPEAVLVRCAQALARRSARGA